MPSNAENVRSQIAARLAGKPAVAPMVVHETPTMGLTNRELRELCEKNPDHPMSVLKLSSIAGFPDDREMYHETADIMAILDNKLVTTKDEIEDNDKGDRIRVRRKVLVDFPAGKAPKPLEDMSAKKANEGKPRPEVPSP